MDDDAALAEAIEKKKKELASASHHSCLMPRETVLPHHLILLHPFLLCRTGGIAEAVAD
jgi:hypothetical protein